jgi:hypothetical protein
MRPETPGRALPDGPRRRSRAGRLFLAGLALAGAVAVVGGAGDDPPAADAAASVTRPRLLVSEHDPWSGLPALRARWAAGERPPEDLPGLALSYLLSGDESYARRALEELRADRPTGWKGSSRYIRYFRRALAFDWLYGYPGFDDAFKDAIAADLVDGAQQMLSLPSLRDPDQASYHNHTVRELALAVFSLAAVEGHPSVEARAAPLRRQAWRAFDNILETSELVDPDGAYHESTDYMRITWAPLAMMAELRRTTTGEDPALRWSVFRNMGETYLYKVLPDGTEARDDDDEFPFLDSRDDVVLGYAVHRFKDPYAAWLLTQRAPQEVGEPGARVPVARSHRRAAGPRGHERDGAPAVPALRRRGPPRPPERLRQGRDLDRARLRALLRQARSPRHQPLRDLPQGLPGHRQRRRLHRDREPALPELLPADGGPQHDARLRARRAVLLGREPLGGRERASRTGSARGTSGTAGGSRLSTPVPGATSTPGATAPGPTSPPRSTASCGRSCGSPAATSCS